MQDSLGDRMKRYESSTQLNLMRRSYTIIRIDGKAFHTYTRGLLRPFDANLMADMDATAAYLCENIQGAKFAYVQSDEISILLTDFDKLESQAWFDYNTQKMVSISASLATAMFNQLRAKRHISNFEDEEIVDTINDLSEYWEERLAHRLIADKLAHFDSRVFQVPNQSEAANYFVWRQQDAVRNSISSVAQSLYSTKELHKKNSNEQQEMIWQKGTNWNDYNSREKRGGFIDKVMHQVPQPNNFDLLVLRSKWESIDCPIFTQDRDFLLSRIPESV